MPPTRLDLPAIFGKASAREVDSRPLSQVLCLLIYEMVDGVEGVWMVSVPRCRLTQGAGEVVEACVGLRRGGRRWVLAPGIDVEPYPLGHWDMLPLTEVVCGCECLRRGVVGGPIQCHHTAIQACLPFLPRVPGLLFTTDSNMKVTQRQQDLSLGVFGGEQATDLPRPVCIVRSQADGLLDLGTLRRCRGYLSPMTDNGGDWQGRAQIKSPAGQWETWQLPSPLVPAR